MQLSRIQDDRGLRRPSGLVAWAKCLTTRNGRLGNVPIHIVSGMSLPEVLEQNVDCKMLGYRGDSTEDSLDAEKSRKHMHILVTMSGYFLMGGEGKSL